MKPDGTPAQTPDAGVRPRAGSGAVISRFATAFFLMAALSLVWSATGWGTLSATDAPFATWTSTAIDQFLSNKCGRPQIAFLGSSLMLT
ncbi:MAG: hypothetical protein ACRD3W_02140, partial [Terriglobales bacterium]